MKVTRLSSNYVTNYSERRFFRAIVCQMEERIRSIGVDIKEIGTPTGDKQIPPSGR